jgi:hypothetical protein
MLSCATACGEVLPTTLFLGALWATAPLLIFEGERAGGFLPVAIKAADNLTDGSTDAAPWPGT